MSRADLWQFAGTVALEIEIERANFGCDYDYNQGNQVRLQALQYLQHSINKIFIYIGQTSGG